MATNTVTTASEIPSWMEGFYTGTPAVTGTVDPTTGVVTGGAPAVPGLLNRAYTESMKNYSGANANLLASGLGGLGGIAGMSEGQQRLGQQLGQMQTPGQFGLGTEAGQVASSGYQGLLNMAGPGAFTQERAQQYMSPYQQSVTDIAQRNAIAEAQKAQLGVNLGAARTGTYGGARQALLQGGREAGLRTTLSDIGIKGLQDAYTNAQSQFERDRAAEYQQNQLRLGASQGLTQQAGVFGNLGTAQQAADVDRSKILGAYGDLQRGIEQQGLDAQIAEAKARDQFGKEQIGYMSNVLRGVPTGDQTQTTTTPPPSFASQLTGLGLTGLSLYNAMK